MEDVTESERRLHLRPARLFNKDCQCVEMTSQGLFNILKSQHVYVLPLGNSFNWRFMSHVIIAFTDEDP